MKTKRAFLVLPALEFCAVLITQSLAQHGGSVSRRGVGGGGDNFRQDKQDKTDEQDRTEIMPDRRDRMGR